MNEAEARAELIDSAIGELGSIPNISAIFVEFQQHLYSQDNLA
jgi:hypothetical protein